ncbi:hypothetical protein PQ462_15005 [Flavobacterium sp. KACC 22758]|uniref:NACHT domain-containing protein n=1 Tax=Flavobacterium sp. KACC 22758 TaxID=3025667 RepID=UPI0023673701|nr:hypothetical protein [Flavobacterium sp. KACC 22758]WDF58025.1 hypothetical protein PQ462_15005 [Flavobacterium sp. KACC 22758]
MVAIFITVLIILLLVCIGYILYLKIFKKYTRERFAFFGVTSMVMLISTVLLQIFSGVGYIGALLQTTNLVIGTSYSTPNVTFSDYVVMLICIITLTRFIYKIHQNWNGPISERHYEKNRFNENSGLFFEAFLQFKDWLTSQNLIIKHNWQKTETLHAIFGIREEDKMPWHEHVFELLTFADKQYIIDFDNDFYRDYKCFISKYGKENEVIAIYCDYELPSNEEIKEFIGFCNSLKEFPSRYIIAIKNTVEKNYEINFEGIQIKVKCEEEMLNELVDFTAYKNYLLKLFEKQEINSSSPLHLCDTYVPLNFKIEGEPDVIENIENYILDWAGKSENRHLSILGEYGCGKSVLSLKVAIELLKDINKNRIPLLIELRGKSPRNLSLLEVLSTWSSNYRMEPLSLMKLHKAGRILLIFEGFDEMDMIGDREMRLNHFQRLWEFAGDKSKIMITGRPNFFLDDRELKTSLGIDKPNDGSSYSEALLLEKFNENQINEALRCVDEATRLQILEILETSTNSNFFDLVSRPAILFLISVIWKESNLLDNKEKINSALVISEFIKYSYARQSSKKIESPLTEKEREYFMLGIAVGMLNLNGYTNQISGNDLEIIFMKLYKNFPEDLIHSDSAILPKRAGFRERFSDNVHAEESILTDVRSSGILVNDLTRKDFFKFAHKSFFEYQISFYFVEALLQEKTENNIIVNAISRALDSGIDNFNQSQETQSFIAELLTSRINLKDINDHKKLCTDLFKVICPNILFKKHPKVVAYYELYSIPFFLGMSSFLVSLLFLLKDFSIISRIMIASSIGICIGLFMLFSQNIVSSLNYSHKKRMIIWLKSCQHLGIQEETINQVVLPKYVKELKKNTHDIFKVFAYMLYGAARLKSLTDTEREHLAEVLNLEKKEK